MGVIGGTGRNQKNTAATVASQDTGISAPTGHIVEEMLTDVSMAGYSDWKIGNRAELHIEKDSTGDRILTVRDVAGDMLLDDILALTKPFFAGKHHNPLTNNHDGSFWVNLEDHYAAAAPVVPETAETSSTIPTPVVAPSTDIVPGSYAVRSYMVQEMLSDAAEGHSTPWEIDKLVRVELNKKSPGRYVLTVENMTDRNLSPEAIKDIARHFGKVGARKNLNGRVEVDIEK